MKKIMMVKASLFTGLAAITVQAATYHVSPNGNDGDGLSWATAKTTIQAAINLAQTAGDEVVVTNGTYGVISVNDDRAITIRSVNGAAVTVINGNNGSRCATLGGSAAHTNIVLSGFTLRNGYVSVMGGGGVVYGTLNNCTLTNNMVSGSFVYGGGAYYSRLNNCTLAGNTVTGINAQGGGAYQSTLSNCLLTNNTATGIFCYGGGAYNSTLDHCTLTGNMAIGQGSEDDSCCGGGAYNSTLNNCTLTGNTADEGGGVAYSTLDTCVLAGNTATDYGGGAYYSTLDNCMLTGNTAYAGGGAYSGTLDNCTLTGNTALGGGGACLGTLVNCTLTGNTATYYGGGSMFSMLNTCTLINNTADYEGGGVDNGTLNNCLLTGNTATSGGGASFTRLNNCVVTNNMAGHSGGGSYFGALNNCLLAGNTATDYAGGACDGTLVNCTLWGNTADEGGGSVSSKLRNCILWENFAIGVYSYYPNYQASPYGSLEYSCTVTTAPGGAGNIAQDPMFVDAANGDFRLQLDSPCINAGNNAYVAGAFDLDGNQRITYGTVDMGAYEMLQPTRYYVSPNGDDTDGLTWATAKTTIQAAIALTMMMEDEIVVTNGTYGAFSVTDDRVITIRSVEGAEHTVIDGNGTDRCATLGSDAAHTNTSLTGFTLRNGYAADFGGGAAYGTLNNCMLTNNTAAYGGGAAYGALANCLLVDNTAENEGGGAAYGTLVNCTVSGNTAVGGGGGGTYGGTLANCIVWGNSASGGSPSNQEYSGGTFAYSCTAPLPGGTGNIDQDPMFVDAANGDFRLQLGSPCMNQGDNAHVAGTLDLDGNPRIQTGIVDMGAYEMQSARYYVSLNGDDTDGLTWATAKKTLQAAVNLAVLEGTEVIVTNGVYASISVTGNRTITIRSVEGSEATVIDGGGTNRCATLGSSTPYTNTVLTGFTLRNGSVTMMSYGGGAYGGTLNNCILTNNTAYHGGGAAYSTLNNCTISGNKITGGWGGGVYDSTLVNCTVSGNTTGNYGGGAYGGTLVNCTVSGNTAGNSGGGAYDSTLNNCVLSGNTATSLGGGAYYGTLNNCTLTGNTATNTTYSYGGGVYNSTLNNCTLSGNTATRGGGGTTYSTLNNCIVWGNTVTSGSGTYSNYDSCTLSYSCTAPMPSGGDDGGGNIDQDPLFMDAAKGDFRLQDDSPCMDAGNNTFAVGDVDLDGNPRIHNGTVDMGVYESPWTVYYVSPGGDGSDGLTWATAKTSIQAAIDLATTPRDKVIVTNGIYGAFSLTDDRFIAIRSVEGAEHTVIDGNGTDRCATLGSDAAHTNTSLTGFALRNGYAVDFGGGTAYGTLNNCVLTNNTAQYGGGAYYGALANCLLADNTANRNGGGAAYGTLVNCTVSGNTAVSGDGGGTYGGTLTNCIVWGNSASGGSPSNQEYFGGTFSHSCTAPLPGGTGNIDQDPIFMDAANGDFRLQNASPCIDAGDNACVVWTLDLDGNPRVTYDIVDMGAYEMQSKCYYVSPGGNDNAAGTSWAWAKKSIQSAVDLALKEGNEVIVTNGTYEAFSVTDNRNITIRSVEGAETTVIDGGGTNRCATLGSATLHTNTVLIGFTLQSGHAYSGGGAAYGTLNNCMLTNNAVTGLGSSGGGAYYGTLNNCILSDNTSEGFGGGASHSTLNNCILSGNVTVRTGGGVDACTLNNCVLTNNTAVEAAGGGSSQGMLNNCLLANNTAGSDGGGANYGILNNCLITGNTAYRGGGANGGTLNNCTISGNTAINNGGGTYETAQRNCIVWGNTSTSSTYSNHYNSTFYYSCTAPLPSGTAVISADPLFMDPANGNFRLQPNSPCINQGDNAYAVGDVDLGGNPRIQNGTVDMGAYEALPSLTETQTTPVHVPYWWLDEKFPANDHAYATYEALAWSIGANGYTVWESYVAGLVPTDANSRFLAYIGITGGNPHIWWTPNYENDPPPLKRVYTVEGKTNLTDAAWHSSTNSGTHFFRVKVGL